VVIPKHGYLDPSPTKITVQLPDVLPAWPAPTVISGDLSAFPTLTTSLDMNVRIGDGAAETISLPSTPTDTTEAARVLQRALRTEATHVARRQARVTTHNNRLIVVSGGLRDAMTFDVASGSTTATELRLTPDSGATAASAYLGGALAEPIRLTAAAPRVTVSIDGTDHVAVMTAVPETPLQAASLLQDSIRTGPGTAFTAARVTLLEEQLLVVPGAAAASVTFSPVAGIDETTVTELRLTGPFGVRVRVNGAESIDELSFNLP
jgi:hypothetical protein